MIIRKLRLQRGWSQEQLAEIQGVSSRTIQRIEQGNKASLESLKCLAAVFETPLNQLQEDEPMTTINPAHEALSDEDRAALKYAHHLKAYDKQYSKGGDDFDPAASSSEKEAIEEVRRLKKFYFSAITYVMIVVLLLIINLLTSPGYLWVIWPALGMGIPVAIQAFHNFGMKGKFGEDWERRQIEERLRNL